MQDWIEKRTRTTFLERCVVVLQVRKIINKFCLVNLLHYASKCLCVDVVKRGIDGNIYTRTYVQKGASACMKQKCIFTRTLF